MLTALCCTCKARILPGSYKTAAEVDAAALKAGWSVENGDHKCPECLAFERPKPVRRQREIGGYIHV